MGMSGRVKELISNTALFTIANIGSKILVFLMVPLYTSVLTTEEYGISDLVQATSQMLFPILTCMISEAVLRFCFINEMDHSQVFGIGFRITIFGAIVCLFLSFIFLRVPFFSSLGLYVLFIPVMFLGQSLSQLFHKYARGIGKVKVSAYAGLLDTVLLISLNLLFLLVFKIGILGYLLAYSLSGYVASGYMAFYCSPKRHRKIESDRDVRHQMLHYSIPLIPNSLSWWALSSVNRYIMLEVLGVSSVGIYSATLRIPSILTVLCDIFAQAWLLSALKDYESKETKDFINLMHSRYFGVVIIITGVFIIGSKPLAETLLAGDFSSYWYVTPFLFISVFWGALVGFLGSIFSAERKNTMQFVSTLIGTLVSILITVLFLKKYGVIVVAIATMLGYFVIWIIRRIAITKYLALSLNTLYSVFQGVVLLVESYLVCNSHYLLAGGCLVLLVLLNLRFVWPIITFGYHELITFVKRRILR